VRAERKREGGISSGRAFFQTGDEMRWMAYLLSDLTDSSSNDRCHLVDRGTGERCFPPAIIPLSSSQTAETKHSSHVSVRTKFTTLSPSPRQPRQANYLSLPLHHGYQRIKVQTTSARPTRAFPKPLSPPPSFALSCPFSFGSRVGGRVEGGSAGGVRGGSLRRHKTI
jgi:hypothetical protein